MFITFSPFQQSYNPFQYQANAYFNGYTQPQQMDATTQAVGEEGGGNYPERPPEEDLIATTLAVGEEGGGDAAFQTNEVLKVLQSADRNGYYYQGDGQLTADELGQYSTQLSQQIAILKGFDQAFPWMGLGSVIGDMERQLATATFMQTNFSGIADADENAETMTVEDVRATASNDGNANDVSQADVQDIVTTQALGEEGGGVDNPQSTIDLMRLQYQWDANRDGQLTNQELDNASDYLTRELERLTSIQTLVFDPHLAAQIERVTHDLEATTFMQRHFDPIAGADGAYYGGNPAAISQFDLLLSAGRDGNIFELDPNELPPGYPLYRATEQATT